MAGQRQPRGRRRSARQGGQTAIEYLLVVAVGTVLVALWAWLIGDAIVAVVAELVGFLQDALA